MSEDEAKALRAAVEKKQREVGRGPFEAELRQRLITHTERRYAAGESVGKIARSLGLSEQTVWSWRKPKRRAKGGSAKLRHVAIAVVEPQVTDRRLTVRGPAGLVIEGATLDDLVALWRRLG